jgi:predicted nucleic acid-binding protein/plasmid stability protein
MSVLTIRNVEPAVTERLRVRAARNGRSMEAEPRQILNDTLLVDPDQEPDLAEAIRRRFAPLGGGGTGAAPTGPRAGSADVRLMILLDTNFISELMRPIPDPAVFTWVARQPRAALYTASICEAEVLLGIASLPRGRRRAMLASAARAVFADDLAGRILPFDSKGAEHYADLVISRRRAGRPIEPFDALIAATARAAGADVATRDHTGFADCGLRLIDPWVGRGRAN